MLIFLSFWFILLLGGLGVEVETVQLFGIFFGILLLLACWGKKKKIALPPFFILYSIFLFLFLIHSFLLSVNAKKSLEVLSLFLGGGLFWIAFYNLKGGFSRSYGYLIISLGIVFGLLAHFYEFVGLKTIRPWSLYAQTSSYHNHNHLGDLWAPVMVILIFHLFRDVKNLLYWFLISVGMYILIISQSRAALLSLSFGLFYLAIKSGLKEKYKNIFIGIICILVIIFLFFGTQKSVLLSRPYFVQSLFGFFRNPQGVGVGNFEMISKDPKNHILGLSGFSSVTHNIVLELLTGMGIMGLIFVYWLYNVWMRLWKSENKRGMLYRALFLTITINFLFDITYFIPTMYWLWFASLGIAQISEPG